MRLPVKRKISYHFDGQVSSSGRISNLSIICQCSFWKVHTPKYWIWRKTFKPLRILVQSHLPVLNKVGPEPRRRENKAVAQNVWQNLIATFDRHILIGPVECRWQRQPFLLCLSYLLFVTDTTDSVCAKKMPGVIFYRYIAKNWQFTVYFVVIYGFFGCKFYSPKIVSV